MELFERFGPAAHPKEPDRFAEGFSLFIASGALVGLWESGSLQIPKGRTANFFYFLIITIGVFGFIWLFLGITDRYIETD